MSKRLLCGDEKSSVDLGSWPEIVTQRDVHKVSCSAKAVMASDRLMAAICWRAVVIGSSDFGVPRAVYEDVRTRES